MNIREIKERFDGNAYKPYFADLFGENKEYFSTHNDISYLLSIIEQAEKAFEEVKTATLFLQHVPPMGMLYDLAEINLQAIRK